MVCSICGSTGHNKKTCKNNIKPNIIQKISFEQFNSDDLFDQKQILINLLKRNQRKSIRFFEENKETTMKLFENPKTINLILAPPGCGKTSQMDHIMYYKTCMAPDKDIIHQDNIFVITCLNDKDWYEQTRKALSLNGKDRFIIDLDHIFHLGTLEKFFMLISTNLNLLNNALIFIDEAHIATSESNDTNDNKLLNKLFEIYGFSKDIINHYNIKFFLVSATPDIIQKEIDLAINANDTSDLQKVFLKPGENYLSFETLYNKKLFVKINTYLDKSHKIKELKFINLIKSSSKNHIIRCFSNSNNFNILIKLLKQNNIKYLFHNSKNRQVNFEIEINNERNEPYVYIIDKFYTAGKRLRLNNNIGYIIEFSTIKSNIPITAQGIIARFLGYYSPEFINNITTKFICDLNAISEYIKYSENFIFTNGYNSKNINKGKILKKKNSLFSENLEYLDDVIIGSKLESESESNYIKLDPIIINNITPQNIKEKFKQYNLSRTHNPFTQDNEIYDNGKIWYTTKISSSNKSIITIKDFEIKLNEWKITNQIPTSSNDTSGTIKTRANLVYSDDFSEMILYVRRIQKK